MLAHTEPSCKLFELLCNFEQSSLIEEKDDILTVQDMKGAKHKRYIKFDQEGEHSKIKFPVKVPVHGKLGERDTIYESIKFFCCPIISPMRATWMQAVMQFSIFSCTAAGEASRSSASVERNKCLVTYLMCRNQIKNVE